MSIKQNLRATIQSRREHELCWSCKLRRLRYGSIVYQPKRKDSICNVPDEDPLLTEASPKYVSVLAGGGRLIRHTPIAGYRSTIIRKHGSFDVQQSGTVRSSNQGRHSLLQDREERVIYSPAGRIGRITTNNVCKPISQKEPSLAAQQYLSPNYQHAHPISIPVTPRKHLYNSSQGSRLSLSGYRNAWGAKRNTGEYGFSNLHPTSCSLQLNAEQQKSSTRERRRQYATTASQSSHSYSYLDQPTPEANGTHKSSLPGGNIREHLKLWQRQQDTNKKLPNSISQPSSNTRNDSQNLFTQSSEDDSFTVVAREDEADEVEGDDKLEFGSDEFVPDVLRNEVFLRRGDLVELLTGTEPILAIFVRNLTDQCQFYTMRGEWLHRETGRARFTVPRFVHPDDLNDILPYLPTAEIAEGMIDRLQPLDVSAPRGAGAKLLEKMSLFHQATDSIFRNNADRLNRAYEIVAPAEPGAGRITLTLGQIAMAVLKKRKTDLTPEMMWAVHRAVVQSQNVMCDSFRTRQNILYEIHPYQNLNEITQVRNWVRDFQESIVEHATKSYDVDSPTTIAPSMSNPITTFVKKARAALEQSRRSRALAPNGALGPSSVRVTTTETPITTYRSIDGQQLSQKERIIVHYLDAWVMSVYLNPLTNLGALGPMILRAVGMYEGLELDKALGYTFLQELGMISPWENRSVHSLVNLQLPGHGSGSKRITQLQNEAFKEHDGSMPLQDSMQGLRKDWADLPIFCVDSAETLERDDGVSVEAVEGSDTEHWVHIHVANPSAFIDPSSATARYAAQLSESVYFPERRYPLLHPALTEGQLSLAKGRPCLTFSARISAEGDVLEKRIVPGVVHNVHYMTPHAVGRELGINKHDGMQSISLLHVGGDSPTESGQQVNKIDQPLPESHLEMLRKLYKISETVQQSRIRNGAPDFYSSANIASTYPRVFLGTDAAPFQLRDDTISIYEGDPVIKIERLIGGYGPVAKMVSELMILAGGIAASWCMERNIPIPYRGIVRNPEPAYSPELFKKEIIEPRIAKYGHANQNDLTRYMRLVGQAAASSSPLEHVALGLPAYCKATSPLRRYVDMYTHWQIEAALRHEAATGTSLIGSTDESYLPFSSAAVEEAANTAHQRERKISNAKTGSSRHWIAQALFRAFYFNEAPLPETFQVTALLRYDRTQRGELNGWDTRVKMMETEATAREGGIKAGDCWEAKISNIKTYYKSIEVEPIRLLERDVQSVHAERG